MIVHYWDELRVYQDALDQHLESVASYLFNNYTSLLPAKKGTLGISQMILLSQRSIQYHVLQ